MKRTTLIYAVVLVLALTAIVAVAQGRRANPPANQPAGCFANCQKMLGLSQNQVAEMTKLRTSFLNDTADLRTDMQAKIKQMADLWAVDDPNLGDIKAVAAQADTLNAEIRDKCIDTRGAMLKQLTKDQRAKCLKLCQTGQCCCGMCGVSGTGMGLCGMGCGNAAGTCPMGMGMGRGRGGAGMGMGRGAGCPMRK
jgi:Spy/CpxP family protein refolding chaperone